MSESPTATTNSDLQQNYDEDLRRRVTNFLVEQEALIEQLEVHADRGSVVVTGIVESNLDKEKCLSCCQRVAGVIKLIDQIEER